MENKKSFTKVFASLLAIVAITFISTILMRSVGYWALILAFIGPLTLQLVVKKKVIVLSIFFISYSIIATFVLYSAWGMLVGAFVYSFIYAFIPTIIGLIGTLVADLILKCRKGL